MILVRILFRGFENIVLSFIVLLYQGAVQIQDVCKSYRPEESLHQHPACHAAITTSLWQHQIRGNSFGICTFHVFEICHFSAGFSMFVSLWCE